MKIYVTQELQADATLIKRSDGIPTIHAAAEDDGVAVKIHVDGVGVLVLTCLVNATADGVNYAATMVPYTGVGGDSITPVGDTGAAPGVTGAIGSTT